MVFAWTRHSIGNLYNPLFYLLSCSVNLVSILFASVTVPVAGPFLSTAGSALLLGLIAEFAMRRRFESGQYRTRYLAKIWLGILSTGTALFFVDRHYILYLPILLGLLYLNVNTILRSRLLQAGITAFMALSVVRAAIRPEGSFLETLSVMIVFLTTSILSTILFRTNKAALEEAENRGEMIMQITRMMNNLMVHDVRNELQKMQVLCLERYRSNPALFMDTMSRFMASLNDLVDMRIYEQSSPIDIRSILGRLSHVTRNEEVAFSTAFDDDEPVLGNRNIIYSTLKNFLENAFEAARRRPPGTCRIALRKTGQRIEIVDDCGGFDASSISAGRTTKAEKSGHGVFLRTITDPSIESIFGFRAEILPATNGTRVVLTFLENPPAPDTPPAVAAGAASDEACAGPPRGPRRPETETSHARRSGGDAAPGIGIRTATQP